MEKRFSAIKNSPTLAKEFENDLIESYNFWKNKGNKIVFRHLYNRMGREESYKKEGEGVHQWSLPSGSDGNNAFRDYCNNIGLICWDEVEKGKNKEYIAHPTDKMFLLTYREKNKIREGENPSKRHGRYNNNLAERYEIEQNAVDLINSYFVDKGYKSKDRQSDNCGWDFEFENESEKLLVEVKGTQSSAISFELTPNEFEKLKNNLEAYRVAMVANCLDQEQINFFIFKFTEQTISGVDAKLVGYCEKTQAKIILEPRTGARAKVS